MTILNKKLLMGLLILAAIALVSSAAIAGGIEWALASLGAMALIGMIGIGIYVPTKVLRYSSRLFTPVEAAPISEKDKRLIMRHIDELFTKDLKQSQENPAEEAPISREDKRLIMAHIDQLFETDWEQSQQMFA